MSLEAHNLTDNENRNLWRRDGFLVVLIAVFLFAWSLDSDARQRAASADVEVELLHVRGSVYMLAAPQANMAVQIGDNGALVVDSMTAGLSEQVIAGIRSLSDKPIRYIINTHAHRQHTGGNANLYAAGKHRVSAFDTVGTAVERDQIGAIIIAHENVLNTMILQEPPPPEDGWPYTTYFNEVKDIFFNGEPVLIIYQPNAHTNGDSLVHFRSSDVISAGGLIDMAGYPFIDVENGGSIQGIIDGLSRIIGLTVPESFQEGGTMVIPGRGRLLDEADVVEYRDMLAIIVSFIRSMIDEGKSLEEIRKARPTQGWDARYGTDESEWSSEQFVTAIYHELSGNGK